jgi:hypothetical protein
MTWPDNQIRKMKRYLLDLSGPSRTNIRAAIVRPIARIISIAIVLSITSLGVTRAGEKDDHIDTKQGRFEGVVWQPANVTNCAGEAVGFFVRGMLETNVYKVEIPKTGPPMMQKSHVVSIHLLGGRRVGVIKGRCFDAFTVFHFAEGDCLMLTDLATYGTGDLEYKDSFYVFHSNKVAELFSDEGDLEVGLLRSTDVNTAAAMRGKELLVRRRHTTFSDWWSGPTKGHRFGRRLVENGSMLQIYCFQLDELIK